MSTRIWWSIIVLLLVIIIVLTWLLVVTPKPVQLPTTSTSTTPVATSTAPLSSSVVVTSPAANATVGQTFTVTGEAPNNWYFEAVFPIQVRDADNNKIAQAQGQAQSDWTVPGQVSFTATVTLDTPYSGAATLVLLKDNESGLPQNDDSFEVPIVIQ